MYYGLSVNNGIRCLGACWIVIVVISNIAAANTIVSTINFNSYSGPVNNREIDRRDNLVRYKNKRSDIILLYKSY